MGKRSTKKQHAERGGTPGASVADDAPPDRNPRRLRGWHGWILRLALLILAPALCLGLLEAALRVAGYGYPTTFFLAPDAGGDCAVNHCYAWRYFPRRLAGQPYPCTLSPKPPGTIRIFVLGGSAAQGFPDWSFSFGRFLAVMLGQQYPDRKFDVVNAALPALNSHAALDIARDCARHEPDLFLVYLGNNEVIGPYGPGTVFPRWMPSLSLIRASLWVKSTRTGELLGGLTTALGFNRAAANRRPGMEMFLGNPVPADDPRLAAVYDNYRRNLTDLCGVARGAQAAVVLCSVAVNLRDLPPLASLHRADLAAADLAQWESLYQSGCAWEASQHWPEAVRQYEAAETIDGHYAELQFRLARCLLRANRGAEAKARFELARDLDVLRFRADSRINAIVREVVTAHEAANVRFADAERALGESNPAADHAYMVPGVAGEDLFYDHVHLTVEGNFVLARSVLEQVAAALPQLAGQRGEVPSRQRCAELLALTPANEYEALSVMLNVLSRPPFTDQLDNAQRRAALRRQRDDLYRRAFSAPAVQSARKVYEEALARSPGDWNLHFRFGGLALQWNQPQLAEEHLRSAIEKAPWNASLYTLLGSALAAQGQFDQAAAMYRKALEIMPTLAAAEKNLAVALAESGQGDEALVHFHQALELDPAFAEAHDNLGKLLATRQHFDEALVHYRQALEIDPAFAEAHDDLGQALFHQGRWDEADEHFRQAVELKPGFAAAHNDLALVCIKRGRRDEALVHYRRALEIKPDYAGAHYNLGMALAGSGQVDEAIAHFRKALEIQPDFVQARRSLEALGTQPP